MSKKTIALIVACGVLVTCLGGFIVWTVTSDLLSVKHPVYQTEAEAIADFEQAMKDIDAILQPYGLHTEPYVQEDDILFDFSVETTVVISDTETMSIDFHGNYGIYPSYLITLNRNDEAAVSIEPSQYPYVCEVAAYLAERYFRGDRAWEERYTSLSKGAMEEAYEDAGDNDTYYWRGFGSREVKSICYDKGYIDFSAEKNHEHNEEGDVLQTTYEYLWIILINVSLS